MSNSFRNGLFHTPYGKTENGANCYNTTGNKCLDLFALGGSMRNRDSGDRIELFREAYDEDANTALQVLMYIGDIRNGQGERDFFRDCYGYLLKAHPLTGVEYFNIIPQLKRWDDLIYIADAGNTKAWDKCMSIIKVQLKQDLINCLSGKPVSLMAKWLPSINASNIKARLVGKRIAKSLGITEREYRKTLSRLRNHIHIIETYITNKEYDKIVYSAIPSKANLKYSKAFWRNDKDRYEEFVNSKDIKMNASVTYPYEIVRAVSRKGYFYDNNGLEDSVVNKMWANLPDYLNGDTSNTICVVDTSGSMEGTPLDVACSLGLYFGERNRGPFKDCYISFSSSPKLVEFASGDFTDKVRKIYKDNLCQNTNIAKVFDLLLDIAKRPTTKREDIPENILIISDMEFDYAQEGDFESAFDSIKRKWDNAGFTMPHLIFHNVDARQNNIPIIDKNQKVSLVSGMSPVIYKTLITGKTGEDLMKEAIKLYSDIVAID